MEKPKGAYQQKCQALLMLAQDKAAQAQVRWRTKALGSWESLKPQWWIQGTKVFFRFRGQGSGPSLSISSIKAKPWGVRIFLSSAKVPIPEAFDVMWGKPDPDLIPEAQQLWKTARYWLRCKCPVHQVVRSSKRPDLAKSLSGLFLRILFRYRGKDCLLIAADVDIGEQSHLAVGQALIWMGIMTSKKQLKDVPMIHMLVPAGTAAVLAHRCRYLNGYRAKATVWEYRQGSAQHPEICRASMPTTPEENKDFRWPVLGPFRWSSQLERVLDLAPDAVRRYPRFQDYDSLRLLGLEFAQVLGPERDRICFGVGSQRTDLTDDNFGCLQSLVREILYFRRAESPDPRHPYYRLQAERWLESLILEEIPHLFPEMAPESVYSQIPVYLGSDPGRVDILGADRQGTLVVMELKTVADSDLPVQALDYWGRVIQHNHNGDFERRGYFSEVRLNRQCPKIYLVSPVFSYHDSTELMLRYLDPNLEVSKISINEDWRSGVKILRRARFHCSELE
jgi:hypothetical protein